MIASLLSSLIGGVTTFFAGRQKLKAAKLDGDIAVIKAEANSRIAVSEAKIKMAQDGQINDFNLDMVAMNNMQKSWKDELILLVFLTPMIMAFIPGLDKYSLRGFEVIKNMPDWYMYIIIGMIVVIYGMRGMLTKILDGKKLFGGKQ